MIQTNDIVSVRFVVSMAGPRDQTLNQESSHQNCGEHTAGHAEGHSRDHRSRPSRSCLRLRGPGHLPRLLCRNGPCQANFARRGRRPSTGIHPRPIPVVIPMNAPTRLQRTVMPKCVKVSLTPCHTPPQFTRISFCDAGTLDGEVIDLGHRKETQSDRDEANSVPQVE